MTEILLFELDALTCALPLGHVREVVAAARPTTLPGAPPLVEGLLDLGGETAVVLDPRVPFGLPRRPIHPDEHFVVLRRTRGRVPYVLRVDRVRGIESLDQDAMVASSEIHPGVVFPAKVGTIAQDDDDAEEGADPVEGVVFLLDAEGLLTEGDERGIAGALERIRGGGLE